MRSLAWSRRFLSCLFSAHTSLSSPGFIDSKWTVSRGEEGKISSGWWAGPQADSFEHCGVFGTPLGVVAGPGTGKTFALMRHVVRLLIEVASARFSRQSTRSQFPKSRLSTSIDTTLSRSWFFIWRLWPGAWGFCRLRFLLLPSAFVD
jgi:hypothetical protein